MAILGHAQFGQLLRREQAALQGLCFRGLGDGGLLPRPAPDGQALEDIVVDLARSRAVLGGVVRALGAGTRGSELRGRWLAVCVCRQ